MKPTSFLLIAILLSSFTLSAKPSSLLIKSFPDGTKIFKEKKWSELQLKDKKNLSEKDSLWIVSGKLSIKCQSDQNVYWAYPGKWSVKQILAGKAEPEIQKKSKNYSTGDVIRVTSSIQEIHVEILDENGNKKETLNKNDLFFVVVRNTGNKPYYACLWWGEKSGSTLNYVNLFSSKESQLIDSLKLTVLAHPSDGFSVYPVDSATYPRDACLYFIYDEKPFEVPLTITHIQELRVAHRVSSIPLSVEE